MRSSYIFEIDRGTLFGRIIFNENANHAVPQDARDFGPIHCEFTGIFTHSGTYKIAVLQWTDFREGPVSSFFFVFLCPRRMRRRGGHFLTPRICCFRAREEPQKVSKPSDEQQNQ